MKDVREWNMWNWDVFVKASDDRTDKFFKSLNWSLISNFIIGITLSVIVDAGLLSAIYLFCLILTVPVAYALPHISKIGVLYGLENEQNWHYYGEPIHNVRFRARAVEYYSLSKEDRRQYPTNIMKIIRDKDLTRNQMIELDKSMEQTYVTICQRNKAKRIITKRNVDIDHMLEYMKDARHGLNVERKTYEEYLHN